MPLPMNGYSSFSSVTLTEVFAESLGTITPFRAKLTVRPDTPPKFFKPRSVPFALRDRVGSELDRLEREGVLERTSYSEWAAPVVVVPKQDGNLRLCDFKVTVNSALEVDQYPLPKLADIFATLAGGKRFTTLDLSDAYNQMLMDDESRRYITINTHQGLYRYYLSASRRPLPFFSVQWTPYYRVSMVLPVTLTIFW